MTKRFNIHDWQSKHLSEMNEGSCGYTHDADGDKLSTPGGTKGRSANSRTQSMRINEKGFDDRLAKQMGMSDDEFEDKIASRDPGDSFPQADIDYLDDIDASGYKKARDLIEKLRQDYRNMSDKELDSFSVEMLLHFIENSSAAAAAKIHFGKKEL